MPPPASLLTLKSWRKLLNASVLALVSCSVVTFVTTPLGNLLDLVNIALLYLLNVVVLAVWYGRLAAIIGAIFGSLVFAHIFVPPLFSLAITDPSYLITAVEMLLVALLAGHLTAGLGSKAKEAANREEMLASVYALAADLAGAPDLDAVTRSVSHFLSATAKGSNHAVFLNDESQRLRLIGQRDLPADLSFEEAYLAAETHTLIERREGESGSQYFPLAMKNNCHGVIAVAWRERELELLERQRLQMLASLVTATIERVRYADLARNAMLKAETEQLRSSILSALSHDIRTPLTSVVGLSDALEASQPALAPHQLEMAHELRELAGQISSMVSNLLDMARLRSGQLRLRLEWQPLEEVIGVALEQIRRRNTGHAIKVSIPPDLPLLEFDTTLIERVICNLLENAIKFSPDGDIQLVAQEQRNTVAISVLDEGPGIPSGAEEKIFEPFVQMKQESSTPGVGLGLAICRTILTAHGGEIRASTRREGGARFTFTLPKGNPPEAEEAPNEEGAQT
ncbi:MAG: hypothetical protein BSR46_11850 [Candidatus Dactylopiibacterium carminicum]|nr:ATP-binding protein [Candidatus Dactylopiibacterium carminicum]PAS98557.1 MAG: hypothetical protein BSR46_11850 [Candidatus Dactylopiibacterium carminicum]